MTRSKHIGFVLLILISLLVEVFPLKLFSLIGALVAIVISTYYSYQLARNRHWIAYTIVILAIAFSVAYLSRPVIHYGHGQYDVTTGTYNGNPHYHPIWEFDHVH